MAPRATSNKAASTSSKAPTASKRKRESSSSSSAPASAAASSSPDRTSTKASKLAPPARKRTHRASTEEADTSVVTTSSTDSNGSLAPPNPKRQRRSSSISSADSSAPTANGTARRRRVQRGAGRVTPAFQPRLGMNPLPRALPLVSPQALATNTASTLSNPSTAFSSSSTTSTEPSSVLARHPLVWGSADSGQLGLGPDVTDEIARPKLHQPLAEAIVAGDGWPKNGIETAVAGGMHTLAIDTAGALWSWGVNDNAALGRQTARDPNVPSDVSESTPHRVEGLGPQGHGIDPQTGKQGDVYPFRATRVAAADCASVALSADGELRCWGSFRSNEGLLGFESSEGASKMQYAPVPIPALSRHTFSSVTAGENHFLALTTDGMVYAWGNGEQAQLGRKILARRKLNALTPEKVGIKKVRLIGSGAYHSFAVDASENVWVWGLNMRHQSGLNLAHGDLIEAPTLIPALSRTHKDCQIPEGVTIVQIAAGSAHSLFLLSNGEVWGCGRSDGGEIGLDADHEVMKDIQLKKEEWQTERAKELEQEMKDWQARMDKQRAAAASTGSNGNGFTLGEGAVASYDDMPPTMGAPPDEYVGVPTKIPFPEEDGAAGKATRIVQVSCGARFSMAVSATGKMYAWGTGPSCELGLGADEEMVAVPTLVRSVEFKKRGWVPVAVSAGGQHCIALAVNPAGDAAVAAASA